MSDRRPHMPPPLIPEDDHFIQLVYAYLDGCISKSATDKLRAMLKADEQNQDKFISICMQEQVIRELKSPNAMPDESEDSQFDEERAMLLREVIDQERTARIKREAEAALDKQQAAQCEAERQESMRRLAGLSKPPVGSQTKHYVIPRPLFYGSIAAVIAIAAAIIWPMVAGEDGNTEIAGPNVGQSPVIAQVVASLSESVDATWANGVIIRDGQKLVQGKYELTEGLVRIAYESGAQIYIEAPATFTLDSEKKISLHSGKVVGLCPSEKSRGFIVQAPNAMVKDLGTEFGVEIADDGTTETHVYDGEVELAATVNGKPSNVRPVRLHESEAAAVTPDGGNIREMQADALAFVRPDEFEVNVKAESSSYHRWLKQQYEMKRHPNLVLHYNMAEATRGELRNIARRANDKGHVSFLDQDAWDHKPSWRKGRWPEKAALQFVSAEQQYVAVKDWDDIRPDTEMTLAMWVRIDKDRPGWNILATEWIAGELAIERHGFLLGVAWNTAEFPNSDRPRAVLRLSPDGVRHDSVLDANRGSGSLATDSGRWTHVAFVLSAKESFARLYVDGVEVDKQVYDFENGHLPDTDLPLVLGAKAAGGQFYSDMTIDELTIFNAVLSAPNIRAIFESGKPSD